GVGRRIQGEVDVAGPDLLRHLGLLSKGRAGKLPDHQCPLAHVAELLRERFREDAIRRIAGLVIAEGEGAGLGPGAPGERGQRESERPGAAKERASRQQLALLGGGSVVSVTGLCARWPRGGKPV